MPIYDPDLVDAIRSARADLFAAQAERRRLMLATGHWVPPRQRDVPETQRARAELDAARAMARETAQPDPPPEETRDAHL